MIDINTKSAMQGLISIVTIDIPLGKLSDYLRTFCISRNTKLKILNTLLRHNAVVPDQGYDNIFSLDLIGSD